MPEPTATCQFNQLDLHDSLIKALNDADFVETTEVQTEAIPAALAGNDLLVSAETGSGKTLAFVLPTLQHLLSDNVDHPETRALILAPTRELARQILKEIQSLTKYNGLHAATLTGGQEVKYQAALLRKGPEIVVATPGRLVEHLKLGNLTLKQIEVLVLDEADRMLDMGFTDDLTHILEACSDARQTLLFSATLNHQRCKGFARRALNQPDIINLGIGLNENVAQFVVLADDVKHKDRLLVKLLNDEPYRKVMVFANTRQTATRLEGLLRFHGFRAGLIHGELSQDERNRIVNLLRQDTINCLVATDVAARGLDIDGVDLVVNYDMTRSGDEHIHRSGRTGRAGAEGTSISLVGELEWNLMIGIERYLKASFTRKKVAGLEGKFKGPKKQKGSGKAAASKKRKKTNPSTKASTRPKKRGARKNTAALIGDGLGPMKRK